MPESKFKRVMDWGTPRLVTKNRALTLNQKGSEARSRLLTMAGINRAPKQEKKKQDFEMASVTNFRRRMQEEEKASEGSNMLTRNMTKKVENGIDC